MNSEMDSEACRELVREKVSEKNLRKHMYAVSAIMKGLAEKLGEDPVKWERVGLLHDLDYDETKDDPKEHGLRSAELLSEKLPEEDLLAIKAHNHEYTGVAPSSKMSNALIASDAVSGLVITTALVMPNRKLEEVRVNSVLKKFNDSSFAKNIDRERIEYCEKLGLDKEEFIRVALNSLVEISEELGL